MKKFAVALLLSMTMPCFAQASEDSEWALAMQLPCHSMLTDSECRAHQQRLALLPEGQERQQYLAKYVALIEDRINACGCARGQNAVGMLN